MRSRAENESMYLDLNLMQEAVWISNTIVLEAALPDQLLDALTGHQVLSSNFGQPWLVRLHHV